MLREDYVGRMIQQLNQALARILARRRRGDLAAAEQEVEAAVSAVAGLDIRAVEASDQALLATLLRDPARFAALGRLLAEGADLEDDRGERARAASTRTLALSLLLEASLSARLDPDALALARALRAAGVAVTERHAAIAEALGD